jgi:cytochrome c oxidase subunit 2
MFFQDSATPVMEGIINLHHDLMFFISFILLFVIIVLFRTLNWFKSEANESDKKSALVVHGTVIEVV